VSNPAYHHAAVAKTAATPAKAAPGVAPVNIGSRLATLPPVTPAKTKIAVRTTSPTVISSWNHAAVRPPR
jgi:hypothetical protein